MDGPKLVFEIVLPAGSTAELVLGTLTAFENAAPMFTLSATSGKAGHQYRESNGEPHVWEPDKSPLPPGHYAVETVKRDTSAALLAKMGPFLFRILPDEVVSPGKGRRFDLRVHYDGPAGEPRDGTEGCIGCRPLDEQFFAWMEKWRQQGYWVVPLEVVYG